MSDQDAILKKGQLLEDYVKARDKVRILQVEARQEGKILEGIVQYLQTGGSHGRISMSMPPETYLSEKVAKLVGDLRDSLQEMNALATALAALGIRISVD